jgi:hypothetical protein
MQPVGVVEDVIKTLQLNALFFLVFIKEANDQPGFVVES